MASVVNVYARAFADAIFHERLNPEKTLHEAGALAQLVEENRDLREVWQTPSIPADKKRAVLDAIVEREGFSRTVRNFMAVLIDHGRTVFLQAIVEQTRVELDQRLGFAEAEITTARELSEAERRALEGQVQNLTGKKVRAHYLRDTSILGGAVVRVGSTIYDGSVSGQLERIRQALSS
jgi:F-type H+-transporting ATPase subunit delta